MPDPSSDDAYRLDDLRRVDALLDQALDLHPDERAAFLDHACADQPHLRARLDALLARQNDAEAFLETPALERAAPLLHDDPDDDDRETPDAHVGPYRLIRQIGRGGMGSVFLARRSDGAFDKQVALKLIRRGLDTDDLLSRFRYERQILASLDHPNIARLLDGGSTDDGRPFLVMEYVEGRPITDYCDERRLSLAQRLALFRTVCRAVQYAHQTLVIHRDLKPSNILVTDEGEVKLLDFGIAKLLSEEGLEAEPLVPPTRTGLRVMTPEYAAPEQVRGEAVTTATDVYQLGVLLYELLTGQRPYRIERRVQREIERVILEEAPTRPSTAVGEAETAAVRGTSVERLRRRLSGDLDNIVLKALSKESGRRYGTVEQLAEDLRRHAVGLPVAARPDTAGYRLRKFVGRHRAGVAASAMVAAALLLGLAGTAWQARVAAAERDRARLEAEKATRTAAFLVDLFEAAGPDVAQGRDVTARELLEAGERQIARDLVEQPALRAQMLGVMGEVYYKAGQYDRAGALLREALAFLRTPAAPPLERATTLLRLAGVYEAGGAFDAADSLVVEVLSAETEGGSDREGERTRITLQALSRQASIRWQQGRYDEAEALFRRALARQEATLGPESEEAGQTANDLAVLLEQLGRFDEAQPLYERSLAVGRRNGGPDHPDNLRGEINLAHLAHARGEMEAADSAYAAILPRARRVLGDDHPDVAFMLNLHASVLHDAGALEAAEARYRKAVAIYRRQFDETHPHLSSVLNNLAVLLVARQDYARAAEAFEDVLRARRASRPAGHVDVALALHNLGAVRHMAGDLRRAEAHLREALALYDASLGDGHHRPARTRLRLGQCLADQRRYAEAEPLFLRAHDVLRETYGADAAEVQRAAGHVAAFYDAWGRPDRAAAYRAPPDTTAG